MDIGKAFSYVFEDEQWISKVLLGGVILLIPIVGWIAVSGYMIKVAQNVAQGNPRPLPQWGEFGDHFMRGLYAFVIGLVYLIPVFVLEGLFFCVTGGLAAGTRRGEGTAAGLLGVCFVPLILILSLGLTFVLYAALARYVATNTMSEAFKFKEVIASVRANFTPWLMLWLVSLLAGLVGGLGLIACGIGVLFTSFYGVCVQGHALGQTVAQQGMMGNPYATQQVPPVNYEPPAMQ
jgi:hypothetical protein